MENVQWFHLAFLGLSVVLEVLANIFLKLSNGFKNKAWGIASILLVLGAFTALAQAVKGMDLSIAYAVWGGFGIIATIAMAWILFGQRLRLRGWVGIICLLVGMGLLKLS